MCPRTWGLGRAPAPRKPHSGRQSEGRGAEKVGGGVWCSVPRPGRAALGATSHDACVFVQTGLVAEHRAPAGGLVTQTHSEGRCF